MRRAAEDAHFAGNVVVEHVELQRPGRERVPHEPPDLRLIIDHEDRERFALCDWITHPCIMRAPAAAVRVASTNFTTSLCRDRDPFTRRLWRSP